MARDRVELIVTIIKKKTISAMRYLYLDSEQYQVDILRRKSDHLFESHAQLFEHPDGTLIIGVDDCDQAGQPDDLTGILFEGLRGFKGITF